MLFAPSPAPASSKAEATPCSYVYCLPLINYPFHHVLICSTLNFAWSSQPGLLFSPVLTCSWTSLCSREQAREFHDCLPQASKGGLLSLLSLCACCCQLSVICGLSLGPTLTRCSNRQNQILSPTQISTSLGRIRCQIRREDNRIIRHREWHL